jgi:hypothetical protein
MHRSTEASELLLLRAELKGWATASGISSAHAVVGELAEICRAAEAIAAAIRALPASDHAGSSKQLVEIPAWLYEELLDHAESSRELLRAVCDDIYSTE